MKKILFTFLSLVVALTMFAQGESVRKMRIVYDGEVIFYRDVNLIDSVTFTTEWIDLELAETFITMKVGDSYYLNANMPVEKWTSSDEKVAIVVNGLITALAEGYTVISATVSGITKTCIVQVEAAEPENQLPQVTPPGYGKTTVVLHVPEKTPAGCYAVGTMTNWNIYDTYYQFTPIPGADERWVACTFDYTDGMELKVVAIPTDPNETLSWEYQWGHNNEVEENVVVLRSDGAYIALEFTQEPQLMELTNNGVVYIEIKKWLTSPVVERNQGGLATFYVTVPENTPANALVSVAGSFAVNAWAPGAYVLSRQNDGTYYGQFEIPAAFEYKYVLGFDQEEWSWEYGEARGNREMSVSLYAHDVVEEWLGLPSIPDEESTIGAFSVGEGKQVTFSKGNLQYTQSTNTWSFAENQWDCIGVDNVIGGSVSAGKYGYGKYGVALADKIDLFGWSTDVTNYGIITSPENKDYFGSFVDWGTNQIGTDSTNTWRTLTKDEWYYLLNTRANADLLCGIAQVSGVNGLIFLPDNWTCPSGVTFKSGFHSEWSVEAYGLYQNFTAEQWSILEALGAVFLPAAGTRIESWSGGGEGFYWSATEYSSEETYNLMFYSPFAGMTYMDRYFGQSVRLVKDLSKNSDTPDIPNQPETAELCLESADERAVFFQGSELGTSANVYMWIRGTYTDLVGAWPGSAATPMGDGTFKFVVPANVTSSPSEWMIIWNDNGVQTDDLDFVMHGLYNMHGCQGTVTALCEENTPDEPVNNGHEYVDLGLSVKWATCNVGANSPEEYGDYFAWGETAPKEIYDWSTYKWCNGSYDSLTKYNTDSSCGTVDNIIVLEAVDDAATANWGGAWRMPTDYELTELHKLCTWTWTTENGVNGYRVTSKSNGNSIFLPAAGLRYANSLFDAGSSGYIWSNSLYTYQPVTANLLSCVSSYVNDGSNSRCCGNSVRPVCP